MDAPGRPAALTDEMELAQLRSRAYGPDADIAGDPAAQARLDELESARRRTVGASHDTALVHETVEVPPAAARSPEPASSIESSADLTNPAASNVSAAIPPADPATGASVTITADGVPPASSPSPVPGPERPGTPWWRRRLWWGVIGGAAVAAVVLVGGVAAVIPHPEATLRVTSSDSQGPVRVDLFGGVDELGLERSDLRLHDEFRGLQVWSGETEAGSRCLFITGALSSNWGRSCTPSGLDPTIDLYKYAGFNDRVFGYIPDGSVIRFVLRGDAVEVWIAQAQTQASTLP